MVVTSTFFELQAGPDLSHEAEIAAGSRFPFGENWVRFLSLLNEQRIERAQRSLSEMLGVSNLAGKSFLDIGSGSGLFSLAARRLGARVHSFDFDPRSMGCTRELRRRFFHDDPLWTLEEGSVLDTEYLKGLGRFDVVYSWGVLHHTGSMWKALENVVPLVERGGQLFLAIYNDQGRTSAGWLLVKKAYNRVPEGLHWIVLWPALVRLWGPTLIRDSMRGRPFETWRNYVEIGTRGMTPWRDLVDWVGGLPFEVAKPEQIFDFYRARGFQLQRLSTCGGGLGCNQYVFRADS